MLRTEREGVDGREKPLVGYRLFTGESEIVGDRNHPVWVNTTDPYKTAFEHVLHRTDVDILASDFVAPTGVYVYRNGDDSLRISGNAQERGDDGFLIFEFRDPNWADRGQRVAWQSAIRARNVDREVRNISLNYRRMSRRPERGPRYAGR